MWRTPAESVPANASREPSGEMTRNGDATRLTRPRTMSALVTGLTGEAGRCVMFHPAMARETTATAAVAAKTGHETLRVTAGAVAVLATVAVAKDAFASASAKAFALSKRSAGSF